MINVLKVPARLSRSLRFVVRLIEFLLVLLLCTVTAVAGWRELKPIFGGAVNRIVVDAGGTLYAATNGGPFKSQDDGQTWLSALGDLPTSSVTAMAADPAVAGIIYAGTDQGLFRTADGGGVWTKLQLNLPGISIQEIAVAPSNRNYIFVATWGAYVWRSVDSGATWTQQSSGLYGGWGGPSYIPAIAVDPTDANRVYTSTWRGYMFRSDNAGGSWYVIDSGSGNWANGQIHVARSSPNVFYTTQDERWFGKGTVLKSTNNGDSWSNVGRPSGYVSDAYALAIDPTDPNTVFVTTGYGGIYKSSNGGNTWVQAFVPPTGLPYMTAVAVNPADHSRVYGGSYYTGFYRSLNYGGTWVQQNQGLAAATITGIEICRDAPSVIYAAAQGAGYFKSADGGTTWSPIGTAQGFQNMYVGGLGVHPQDPNVLVTSASGNFSGGTWRTTDGGASFTQVSGYGSGWYRFNPLIPSNVSASIGDSQGGFLFSSNAGATWRVPHRQYIYPGNYDFHPALPNVVFGVGSEYTGYPVTSLYLMWSNTGGDYPWNRSSWLGYAGWPDLALDKQDPTTLYLAGRIQNEGTQGVYKFNVSYSGSNVVSVTRIPGTFNTGLTNTAVRRIIYDNATGSLYLSTANGVFRSKDQAATWTSLSAGLPYTSTDIMAITPDGKRLLVGTSGGIWEYTDNRPPVADAGPDQRVSANSSCQGEVTLEGTGSTDPDNDTLTYTWSGPFGTATGATPTVKHLALGTHTITLTVDDGKGGTATDTVAVTVYDGTPPTIGSLSATPNVLWPPNHNMVVVTVRASVLDSCDPAPTWTIVLVTSNEPANGLGDGDLSPDWMITGDHTVSLRAERSGTGNGRIYTITVQATDASGNMSVQSLTVSVPKNQKAT